MGGETLKIAFDATAIPRNRAGAGIYIFNVVRALARIDSCHGYTIFAHPDFIQEFAIDQPNFTFVAIEYRSMVERLWWEQTGLPRELQRRGVHILHSPHYTMPVRLPCRSVVTFHDMTFFLMPELHPGSRARMFRAMMRWSVKHADRLIAVSESTRQDVCRMLKVSPDRMVTVPLAADSSFRRMPSGEVADVCARHGVEVDRYVMFTGVLEPRKNVPTLLKAYAALAADYPDVPLVIVGKKGWMYDTIFEQTRALGLQNRVLFTGYVPESELVALYNGARAFVYPSWYEGFGLPVLEALQCGTPVITSNVSSMPEVAGDAADLVAPDDVVGLENALRRLLSDDAHALKRSQCGRARAEQFSWQRCAHETLAVYRSLVQTHFSEE